MKSSNTFFPSSGRNFISFSSISFICSTAFSESCPSGRNPSLNSSMFQYLAPEMLAIKGLQPSGQSQKILVEMLVQTSLNPLIFQLFQPLSKSNCIIIVLLIKKHLCSLLDHLLNNFQSLVWKIISRMFLEFEIHQMTQPFTVL